MTSDGVGRPHRRLSFLRSRCTSQPFETLEPARHSVPTGACQVHQPSPNRSLRSLAPAGRPATLIMSTTPAIRVLRQYDVEFTTHEYRYEEHGGTRVASDQLGVDEHAVVKTMVLEDEAGHPFLVLMHGDREVSTKRLARQIGRKTVRSCEAADAERHTGYQVGGISPFSTRKRLSVFVESSVLDLAAIYINGGRRGCLVRIAPGELTRVLGAVPIAAAIQPSD